MKFLTFKYNNQTSFGAVLNDGVVDLGKRHSDITDLRHAIHDDRLNALASDATSAIADYSLDDIVFLPPIINPEKII